MLKVIALIEPAQSNPNSLIENFLLQLYISMTHKTKNLKKDPPVLLTTNGNAIASQAKDASSVFPVASKSFQNIKNQYPFIWKLNKLSFLVKCS